MATGAVISGATRGRGGVALGRHLADRRRVRQNDEVRLGATRGIVSEDIEAAIAELTRIASHARSKEPLYHVHLDPELPWSEQQRERYWQLFEEEFGFQNQPFVEAVHIKHGRAHDHRVYSRVLRNGTIIPLKFDYARREKLSRIVEVEFGGRHIAGRHNRAVAAALKKEGRLEVLQSIEAAGLTSVARPVADMTPDERHQFEHTGMDPRVIASVALAAWHDTVSGEDFIAALVREGLHLAMGSTAPVLVDLAGGAHSLTRLIGKASAATGMRIKAKEVKARIANLKLPLHQPHGDTRHDENQITGAASLDTQDHHQSLEAKTRRSRGVARESSKNRGRGRRLWLDRSGIRVIARAEQYREDEKPHGAIGDTPAGGAHKSGKNSFIVGGDRQIKRAARQRPGGSRRAVGRARAADRRLEGILDEPAFQQPIDRIVAWTALLDPGAAMRQRAEETRVEMMLNEPEFSPSISAIEELALFLVRLLAWLFTVLFGGTMEGRPEYETEKPLTVEEPSYPGPAP
jgi:hypothetical protein